MTTVSGTLGRKGAFFFKAHRFLLSLLVVIFVLVGAAWYFTPAWLPLLAQRYLPADVRLILDGRPVWRQGQLALPDIRLVRGNCDWLDGSGVSLGRGNGGWRLDARQVTANTLCAASAADSGAPLTWQGVLGELPSFSLHIQRLSVAPWQAYGGELQLVHRGNDTRLNYRGGEVTADLRMLDRQLTVNDLTLNDAAGRQWVRLQGSLGLSPQILLPPERGALTAGMASPDGTPLIARFDWRQQNGELTISDGQTDFTLARLPWQVSDESIAISGGEWHWPYASQPLAGHISLNLKNWQAGLVGLEISARLNVLTEGLRGKANAVLNLGPGKIGLTDNALDFRLTGLANQGDLSLDASIPGQLRGPLSDPVLVMSPGALLRVVGPLFNVLNITSARLPLAGMQLSSRGLSGRLQAILLADAARMGNLTLHLDGRASNFLPDQGQWRWRYWGNGYLSPFHARWDINGRGSWLEDMIELSEMNSGFDGLEYGLVQVDEPRLKLVTPFRWQRKASQPAFSGGVSLAARRIDIKRGGYMPQPRLVLQLSGRDPQDFLWRGKLQAGAIGPVRVNGRWDGTRLRGQAWWPQQPLRVFQTLLAPELKMTLRDGEFHAQSAFSAAPGQGFLAGGHAVVSEGDVWMQENHLQGIALGLSYRLQDQRWLLGVKQPVTLNIDKVVTPINLDHLALGLQGYYPYDERRPLTLTQAAVDTLGGSIRLSPLRLPQREAAVLSLKSIEMSELITVLNTRQFAVSGRVSGELPLNFADPAGYIRHGWLANDDNMTLRLDKQFADQLGSSNLATRAAIDWLRYMEITRTRAEVDLDRSGNLLLLAHITGTNSQINAQREVRLNYRHQENLFQLWRSLRFGTQVEQTLEKQAAQPALTTRGAQ
ncbi:YdbH family protein [Sodalis ligni]|uniref:Dicarboxylate transport n=1 Tax=Sodalis ligni TaxID=2697027 RepID=A0A4R1N5X5_9GAMM|nr:YdbH family protein [Sodalis ligni]TCL02523.1 dicarboxylate transport [Sodalis ligni]